MNESDLSEYADEQGIDFDALLVGASRHFQSNTIIRRTLPLTDAEV